MINDNQTNKIYFSPALERDCQSHKLRENIVYLQRERNLFRTRAPFGLASDLLK